VATLAWNRWQVCSGIGGRFALESTIIDKQAYKESLEGKIKNIDKLIAETEKEMSNVET